MSMIDEAVSLSGFCRTILQSGSLDAKLASPPLDLDDCNRDAAQCVDHPAREAGLEFSADSGPLPRPGELSAPQARAVCLARFAHHELMAVELFAWALLRWPELPGGLRAGFLRVLAQEQVHCRLYLERLSAHGCALTDFALSDYFWKHVPAIDRSPHGPAAFLCAMGLTLEQANLDFSLVYRDAFRSAGDEASARVCQRVHDDEIEHVRFALEALRQLDPDADDIERYERAVPFPLSAARAKGRRFDVASRRRAGLEDAYIEHVRGARSSQELHPRRDRDRVRE
jgi:uncharacterized ferritin-like protein (DUF455 family)